MAPRRKTLTAQDRDEWAAYVQRVRPMAGRAVPPAPAPAAATVPTPPALPLSPPPRLKHTPAALAVGDAPGGLDRASWTCLRTGKLTPERTLDLHGRTAQRAFHALHAFLVAAHADGLRCVEVITGRGTGEAGGVIRREFPLWINLPALRPLVLAASHPHAANTGSVRLLIRRAR